ncbi:Uncharacterised protein [Bordetella pertussis]|nr:Uncharacterised protein [Bordetella pertussis]
MTAVASRSLEQNSAVGAWAACTACCRVDRFEAVCVGMARCATGSSPSVRAAARAFEAAPRPVRGGQRPGHQRDAAVSQIGQALHHVARGGAVVDRHKRVRPRFVIGQHMRHLRLFEGLQRGIAGRVADGQDQAVDLVVDQRLHGVGLDRGLVVGRRHHDAVAGAACILFGALEAIGEYRVGQREQQQADGARAAGAQAAAHAVGPKAAALRDRFDMRERIGLEQRGLVEGARYRGGRSR